MRSHRFGHGLHGVLVNGRRLLAGVAVVGVTGVLVGYPSQAARVPDPERPHEHEHTQDLEVAAADPTLGRSGWTATASSQQGTLPAGNVLDGNTATIWHSQYTPTVVAHPHTITIDMQAANIVSGLRYLPRTDGTANGRIGGYQIHVSADGTTWNPIATGTFSDDPSEKTVPFTPTAARFVRLTAQSEAGNRGPWTSAAELNLIGIPAPTLPRTGWTTTASSQQGTLPAGNVLDGNTATIWHSQYTPTVVAHPHTITIDMQAANIVSGLRYLPRTDGTANGRIGGYQIHLSGDGTTWGNPVAAGTLPDTAGEKTVAFTPTTARFVRLTAQSEAGNRGPWTSAAELNLIGIPAPTLPRTGWTATASSQQGTMPAGNAIDGNDSTLWHSQYTPTVVPHPHSITIDMRAANIVSGLRYLPRPSASANGRIGGYQIHLSGDGTTWGNPVAAGTFPDTGSDKLVSFPATSGRYVRLTALTEAGNRGPWTSAAEVNIIGVPQERSVGVTGAWGPTVGFPLVPVAAAVLPNGNVLAWSAYAADNYIPQEMGFTQTAIWNPGTGTVSPKTVANTGHDMFCPGISSLADGRIMVTGGSGAAKTSLYNPSTDSWSTGPQLTKGRGYQSSVTLSNGGVFTLGGSWSGGYGGKDGEVWSPATGWRALPGVPVGPILTNDPAGVFRADNHGWFFAAANGRVFHAGPSRQMNWIDTNGNGSITPAGNRGDDEHAMNGNAVMYDVGKILTVGGATAYQYANATANAYVIDINGGGAAVRKVASMAHPRAYHNSVVLPDGKVLVLGGQRYPIVFSENDSTFASELWDPATETFTTVAPLDPVPRNYHSVSALLPDGRVFVGGGGLCGNCGTNRPDGQVYSPPYLFKADGSPAPRPAITGAPAASTPGASITVSTDRAVSGFSLVRMSTVTHSVNTDQRRVPLTASSASGTTYTVGLPTDPGVLVPGYYLLFALDATGVPSVAKSIRIS